MKVIGTTKISNEIEELLNSAEKYLILVSPYLKINQRLKVRLSDAFKKVKKVIILYRENGVSPYELEWIKNFENVNLYSIKNLHSKIYVNEEFALITSMNLYEYSQINNHEIGIKLDYDNDSLEFKEVLNEIRIIVETEYELHDFHEIIESTIDYSMGTLFWRLDEKYTFKNYNSSSQYLYEYICDKCREFVSFSPNELYLDDTAILRATDLGKKRYQLLEKELIKLAN